ncbi:hypothetical protein [Leifsonia sp. 22587]|uniref:hypothetical protein n=1 Tax=Leifsonia sp. 22587 TaxID=3453946 RepID=UPI003F852EC6
MPTLPERIVNASCATAPPSGQECNDTVALTVAVPWWVTLLVFAAGVLIVAVAVYFGTRSPKN